MLQITNENFNSILTNPFVLVDFFAEWCKPCVFMMPYLEELESEIEDVLICKADVDKNDNLCSELGISTVPTLILFKDGVETKRLIGSQSKKDIISMIRGEL